MPYGYGFRGGSPPWPYVGRGRGGLPRCWYSGAFTIPPHYGGYPAPEETPYTPRMPREQELEFLKGEANAIREEMEEIEARIKELQAEEG